VRFHFTHAGDLWNELDQLDEEMKSDLQFREIIVGSAALGSNVASLRAQGLLLCLSWPGHFWIFVSSSFDFSWFLSTGAVTYVVARDRP
jgi:hypothetical protein